MSRSDKKRYIVMKTTGYSWKSQSTVVVFPKNRTVAGDLESDGLISILNVPPDLTITGLLWTASKRSWHSFFRVLTQPICNQSDEIYTFFRQEQKTFCGVEIQFMHEQWLLWSQDTKKIKETKQKQRISIWRICDMISALKGSIKKYSSKACTPSLERQNGKLGI